MIRLFILIVTVVGFALSVFSYGPTAHRAIALIAYEELTPKARKQVDRILGKHGLIYTSTWADEIRSEPEKYSYSFQWHFQNLLPDKTPDDLKTLWENPVSEGEHLFYAIQTMTQRLQKNRNDAEALKFLVHFMGDLHQPMHLGRKEDLGGNRIPFTWFGDKTNLHTLWDTHLVEHKKMSFTELAAFLKNTQGHQKKELHQLTIPQMLTRVHALTNQIYAYDSTDTSSFLYAYRFSDDLDIMMYGGAIQLAKLLNQIYR